MTKQTRNNFAYQFVAELKNFKPRIWRRFEIGKDSSLADLGYALIVMFEGRASHLFQFCDSKTRNVYYECACAEPIDIFGPAPYQSLDARDFTLTEIFSKVGDKLEFEYDFGDSWQFKVKLEKIIERNPELKVLEGAGYGIIEDCGGVVGLNHIAELCKERGGEEYEEAAGWMDKFDINEFNLETANRSLRDQVELVKHAYEDEPENY